MKKTGIFRTVGYELIEASDRGMVWRGCWARGRWKQCLCYTFATLTVCYLLMVTWLHSTKTIVSPVQVNTFSPIVHTNSPSSFNDPFPDDNVVGLKGLRHIDCASAIEGFLPESSQVRASGASNARLSNDLIRREAGAGCAAWRARHGYERYGGVTAEELAFPLAFNILLYKDVDQLHVLLRALYRPHNSFCLHVDGHAERGVLEATRALAQCLPGVFLASRLYNITYAGFNRLQADVDCMADHWRRSQGQSSPWRYLLNLPSQNFPLKTNRELVRVLTIYNGSNDVEGLLGKRMLHSRYTFKHKYETDPKSGRQRLVKTDKPHPPPPHNLTVVKGSAYCVLSRAFVGFVLQDRRAKDLLEWAREVKSPDEYYWATLHHNPSLAAPGSYRGAADQKPWLAVYASWPPRDPCLSRRVVRGVCIFGVKDLPQLTARRELFANKFYMDFEPAALHCLDQWLFNKSRANLPVDTFYYRQLPFVHR